MRSLSRLRHLLAAAFVVMVAAGCGAQSPDGPGGQQPDAAAGQRLNVQPRASFDLAATGEPGRFITGVVTPGNESLVGGTVDMEFAFLGTDQASGTPKPGPTARGSFLPVPNKAPERTFDQPTAVPPAEGIGVYETEVAFDKPGFWQVTVTADVADQGTMRGTGAFQVFERHTVPQVGDKAPEADNLTMDDVGQVPKAAIDSRAGTGDSAIPDPELHRTTISRALDQQRPFVVLFSTPVYCQSLFCGPITEAVQDLAQQYDDKAAFIHVEVWRDFEGRQLNDAYDVWANQAGEGREPWLFAVDADGIIQQRWGNVPDLEAVESWLHQLPAS